MVEHGVQPYAQAWRRRIADERRADNEAAVASRAVAKRCAEVLVERFGVARVYLFGSAATNARRRFGARSDLDLAVEELPDDRYVEALRAVSEITGDQLPVDLVPLETAPDSLRRAVRDGGELLYERA